LDSSFDIGSRERKLAARNLAPICRSSQIVRKIKRAASNAYASLPGKSAKRVFALDNPAIHQNEKALRSGMDAQVKPAHEFG
jgi:hypothetical protein